MFEKEFRAPIPLQQIEALLRRISVEHVKRPLAEEKAKILRSGYNGEKNLNYFLCLLPEKNYSIFHNIRLPIGSTFFQIDFLLISPKLGIILDSKNHSGTLTFEKNQLIHLSNTTEKINQNPLSQVYRHQYLLNRLFESHQIPKIPIEYHVVVTNPSTKIIISDGYKEAEKRVWKAESLLIKMDEMEKAYNKELIDKRSITKIKKVILQNDTVERIDFLKVFGIHPSEIQTGVLCPTCYIPMEYTYRTWWKCPNCQCTSKNAHLHDIHDYFLLIKPSITNPELRAFLHLPNSRSTTYLLSKLHLPYSGNGKGRTYYPNFTNHVPNLLNKY
ncbi:MAG: nuclease-related domain-containing protein [Bacillota bacterium]|nr:nuclease-related domain-containing protein [Bacillota bacterium]